mgnify:FL=1
MLAIAVLAGFFISVAVAAVECPPSIGLPTVAPVTLEVLEELLNVGGGDFEARTMAEGLSVRVFLTRATDLLQINNVLFKDGSTATLWGVFALVQEQGDSGALSEPACVFVASLVPPRQVPQDKSKKEQKPPDFDRREQIPKIEEPSEVTDFIGHKTSAKGSFFLLT